MIESGLNLHLIIMVQVQPNYLAGEEENMHRGSFCGKAMIILIVIIGLTGLAFAMYSPKSFTPKISSYDAIENLEDNILAKQIAESTFITTEAILEKNIQPSQYNLILNIIYNSGQPQNIIVSMPEVPDGLVVKGASISAISADESYSVEKQGVEAYVYTPKNSRSHKSGMIGTVSIPIFISKKDPSHIEQMPISIQITVKTPTFQKTIAQYTHEINLDWCSE